MTRSTAIGVLMVLMGLTLGGCGALGELLNLPRPTAEIVGVRLADIGLESATLQFNVRVDNPYRTPLPLTDIDYRVRAMEKELLAGKAELRGSIPAKGNRTLAIPAKVSYAAVLGLLPEVRPGSVVPYEAGIDLLVEPPGLGTLRLPLRKEGRLPIPAPPELAVEEIRWDRLDPGEIAATFRLRVGNRNDFDVSLVGLRYALRLAGTDVATSRVGQPVDMPAGGAPVAVEIPVSFSPSQLGLAALQVLAGEPADYELSGTMDVATPFGAMSLPWRQEGTARARR